MSEEEVKRLERLISEDNVDELSNILNSNEILRNTFNTFRSSRKLKSQQSFFTHTREPLLHFAVQERSQKVVEYLLSQDFVDKCITTSQYSNIYHVICGIRGAEELFSTIERIVPHHLLLDISNYKINAFYIACEKNNVFIVKRVHEILETSHANLTQIKNTAMEYAIRNNDIDVIKYVLSIDGIQLTDNILSRAIRASTFDIVVYLLNVYLYQSIPSHLHNQFHIFQFSNIYSNDFNKLLNCSLNDNNSNNDHDIDDYYLKLIEENFLKIISININTNRIWHEVCVNKNLDVVQLIFSLKGIQPDRLYGGEFNSFLIACIQNANIKVIKYIHKLFPPFIHSQIDENGKGRNGAFLIFHSYQLGRSDQLKILHYFYLNGIDIHLLSELKRKKSNQYQSVYSVINLYVPDFYDMIQYLKVISQDFDYLHNEHDDKAYRKPSFWKQFHNNNNNNNNNNDNNNNNNIADEQSMRINEWKNRFDEHVLHRFSKMIQEHMLDPNQIQLSDADDEFDLDDDYDIDLFS